MDMVALTLVCRQIGYCAFSVGEKTQQIGARGIIIVL